MSFVNFTFEKKQRNLDQIVEIPDVSPDQSFNFDSLGKKEANILQNEEKKADRTKFRELYLQNRKKSSFFNSQDLRVSRQEGFDIQENHLQREHSPLMKGKTNKSTNFIDIESQSDEKGKSCGNDNSNLEFIEKSDGLSSNFTNMISIIQNNYISYEKPVQNTKEDNKLFTDNSLDFDIKCSPILVKKKDNISEKAKELSFKKIIHQEQSESKGKGNTVNPSNSREILSISSHIQIDIMHQ